VRALLGGARAVWLARCQTPAPAAAAAAADDSGGLDQVVLLGWTDRQTDAACHAHMADRMNKNATARPPARRRRRCGRSGGRSANAQTCMRRRERPGSRQRRDCMDPPAHRVELTTTLRDRHSSEPPGPPAAAAAAVAVAAARAGPGPASPRLQLPVMEANSTSNPLATRS